MKAMILAAGLGQRLLPLTKNMSKVLLKAGGRSLIEYHLRALAAIGVKDVVINIHHCAALIKEQLGNGAQYNINIIYSEEPQLLNSGGGIYQALDVLGDEPFILLNGDLWTDYPLQTLLNKPATTMLGHLVLVDNPDFHLTGDFSLDNGLLTQRATHTYTYGNVAVLNPKLFQDAQPGNFPLGPLLHSACEQQLLSAEHYSGEWWNINEPQHLEQLQQRL